LLFSFFQGLTLGQLWVFLLSADVVWAGSWFQSLMVLGKNDCPYVCLWSFLVGAVFTSGPLSCCVRYCCLSMSISSCWILNSMLSLAHFLRSSRFSHFNNFTIFVTQPGVRSVQLLCTNLTALFCTCSNFATSLNNEVEYCFTLEKYSTNKLDFVFWTI
jgi:hypothetical protein